MANSTGAGAALDSPALSVRLRQIQKLCRIDTTRLIARNDRSPSSAAATKVRPDSETAGCRTSDQSQDTAR
jgi:hypothetical protein